MAIHFFLLFIAAAAAAPISCPANSREVGQVCLCPASAPVCAGPRCVRGYGKTSLKPIQGFRKTCGHECTCVPGELHQVPALRSTPKPRPVMAGDAAPLPGGPAKGDAEAGGAPVDVLQLKVDHWMDLEGRDANGVRTSFGEPPGNLQPDGTYKVPWPERPDGWRADVAWPPRVLVMTVATHREPFIDLVEEGVRNLGPGVSLYVAGDGDFFKGYGWKLKRVLETLQKFQSEYDLVLFTDSFDTYCFCNMAELVEKFAMFHAPMVVSGEVNLWPNPHLKDALPTTCREDGRCVRYPYPNSGGYMGYVDYIIDLYSNVIAIQHKSDCTDDQGELIKALARNHSAFRIDYHAVIFQTLFGYAKEDLRPQDGRLFNINTGNWPCVVHANGWDKGPLLNFLEKTGRLTAEQQASLTEMKAALEKTRTLQKRESAINTRCENHNPNAHLEPERNLIAEYGLLEKQAMLRTRLEARGVSWDIVEQQIFEVQEYLGFCPAPTPFTGLAVVHEKWTPTVNAAAYKRQPCANGFKVYVYPRTDAEVADAYTIYNAVLGSIEELPYITTDPTEACVFIPSVDVSCWCESCLGKRDFSTISPASVDTARRLAELEHWNNGHNHMIFEFSDAPCLPFEVDRAIIATVGVSEFYHRPGLDVSMPLFAMVLFTPEQRRVPAADRRFLLTFRGTRSPKSDAMRLFLPLLHNGRDIVLTCACRWFDHSNNASAYDKACQRDEIEFQKYTYTELAVEAKFALLLEGFGYHSFRLTEVMGAGAIPVIVIDHYTLPYQDLLDWDSFSIRVPEHRMLEVPAILAALTPEEIDRMQRRVVFVYENFFASLAHNVYTAIESVRINLYGGARARAERAALLKHGLPYAVSPRYAQTPAGVQKDSRECNTPAHRRVQARDGAVM